MNEKKEKISNTMKLIGTASILLLLLLAQYSTTAFIPDFCTGVYTYKQEVKTFENRGIYLFSVNPMGYIELMDTRLQHDRLELEVIPEYRHPEKVYVEVYWHINKDKAQSLYQNYGGDRESNSGNDIQKYIRWIVKKIFPEKATELYGKEKGNYMDNLLEPVISEEVKNLYGQYSFSDFYTNPDSDDRSQIIGYIEEKLANEGIVLQQVFVTKERKNGYYGYLYQSEMEQASSKKIAITGLINSGTMENFYARAGGNDTVEYLIGKEIRDELKLWNTADLYENASKETIRININSRITKKIAEMDSSVTPTPQKKRTIANMSYANWIVDVREESADLFIQDLKDRIPADMMEKVIESNGKNGNIFVGPPVLSFSKGPSQNGEPGFTGIYRQ